MEVFLKRFILIGFLLFLGPLWFHCSSGGGSSSGGDGRDSDRQTSSAALTITDVTPCYDLIDEAASTITVTGTDLSGIDSLSVLDRGGSSLDEGAVTLSHLVINSDSQLQFDIDCAEEVEGKLKVGERGTDESAYFERFFCSYSTVDCEQDTTPSEIGSSEDEGDSERPVIDAIISLVVGLVADKLGLPEEGGVWVLWYLPKSVECGKTVTMNALGIGVPFEELGVQVGVLGSDGTVSGAERFERLEGILPSMLAQIRFDEEEEVGTCYFSGVSPGAEATLGIQWIDSTDASVVPLAGNGEDIVSDAMKVTYTAPSEPEPERTEAKVTFWTPLGHTGTCGSTLQIWGDGLEGLTVQVVGGEGTDSRKVVLDEGDLLENPLLEPDDKIAFQFTEENGLCTDWGASNGDEVTLNIQLTDSGGDLVDLKGLLGVDRDDSLELTYTVAGEGSSGGGAALTQRSTSSVDSSVVIRSYTTRGTCRDVVRVVGEEGSGLQDLAIEVGVVGSDGSLEQLYTVSNSGAARGDGDFAQFRSPCDFVPESEDDDTLQLGIRFRDSDGDLVPIEYPEGRSVDYLPFEYLIPLTLNDVLAEACSVLTDLPCSVPDDLNDLLQDLLDRFQGDRCPSSQKEAERLPSIESVLAVEYSDGSDGYVVIGSGFCPVTEITGTVVGKMDTLVTLKTDEKESLTFTGPSGTLTTLIQE